jgi:hypothetical protein
MIQEGVPFGYLQHVDLGFRRFPTFEKEHRGFLGDIFPNEIVFGVSGVFDIYIKPI